jgi:hypothetical protein
MGVVCLKQYEYMVKQIMIEFSSLFNYDKTQQGKEVADKLNEAGKEGWELAGVDGSWFYFKREINEV